ncbi:MAG: glycosyltransferase, partial [Lachnospiraceae bacterium]|nr:glycosyltransferase [Lachnospiraceae bacterium]
MELISVIVPVFEVEKYLKECIESILNQTYTNLEIILVDDGSPDKCGEICEEYAKTDNRIIVIHHENKGLSSARNRGLDIATGDYIGFVDSDDKIAPDMFEILLNNLKQYDADISICGFYRL